FRFGSFNTTNDSQLKIDVGGYNPLLGESYGEIAARSRSQHKSQGFGVAAQRGKQLEYFVATKGNQPASDLMDGIDLSWHKIKGGEEIEEAVNDIAEKFDLLHPEKSVDDLVKLYRKMQKLPEGHWTTKKMDEVKTLIEQCSGLFIEATTNTNYAVQTDSITIQFSINDRLGSQAMVEKISVDDFDTVLHRPLEKNENFGFRETLYVPPDKPLTQPYWLKEKKATGYYHVDDPQLIGQPDVSPAYWVHVDLTIDELPLSFAIPVKYKFTTPVRGELYEPLVVIPSMLLKSEPELRIVINKDEQLGGNLQIQSKKDHIVATPHTDYFLKYHVADPRLKFNIGAVGMTAKNQTINVGYKVQSDTSSSFQFLAKDNNLDYYASSELKEIRYDHVPYINYFVTPEVNFKKIDVKTYNKTIGYIVGAGDKVPEALEQMGYTVTLLTAAELAKESLQQYDAI
ncbi:MAG TPA: PIG-L family deacetylase, partial [Chitinophagaceae bacterium]|nr:PIG-L family deacetylase [Chitinophagaceae bacterium]